jgi:hypothetical protein
MLIKILIFIIGYFTGMLSCLYQVIKMEEKENKNIQDILERKKDE